MKKKFLFTMIAVTLFSGVSFFMTSKVEAAEIAPIKEAHYKWTGLGLCVWPGETCKLVY